MRRSAENFFGGCDWIDYLLDKVVLGQHISLQKIEKHRKENGEPVCEAELLSIRDGATFPLRYESAGIRKPVCVLELLAQVCARHGITLAVDELDSGIFEYLLGELLKIIVAEGEGQLIFTSHDLRPMEVLMPGNIVLATTDPKNRYSRPSGIRDANNQRRQYIRELVLQREDDSSGVYAPTDNDRIAVALEKVGAM